MNRFICGLYLCVSLVNVVRGFENDWIEGIFVSLSSTINENGLSSSKELKTLNGLTEIFSLVSFFIQGERDGNRYIDAESWAVFLSKRYPFSYKHTNYFHTLHSNSIISVFDLFQHSNSVLICCVVAWNIVWFGWGFALKDGQRWKREALKDR